MVWFASVTVVPLRTHVTQCRRHASWCEGDERLEAGCRLSGDFGDDVADLDAGVRWKWSGIVSAVHSGFMSDTGTSPKTVVRCHVAGLVRAMVTAAVAAKLARSARLGLTARSLTGSGSAA
jgi:hypothetical protein